MRRLSFVLVLFAIARLNAGSVIRLKSRMIDTSVAAPAEIATFFAGPVHKIVQFELPPSAAQIDALERAGAKVAGYVPDDAVVVAVDASAALDIEGVRWTSVIDARDKISPEILDTGSTVVLVELYPDVDQNRGRALLLGSGFEIVENPDVGDRRLLARGSGAALIDLAGNDEVAYIFPAMAELSADRPVLACAGPATGVGAIGQYVATAGFGWEGPGRGSAILRYFMLNSPATLPADAAREALARALATWSRYARVDFVAGSSGSASGTVTFAFAARDHGDGFPFDGPGHVLAHTFYPAPIIPEPLAGDMHFDADENWGALAGTDLFSVALHEAGHALGLGHSDNPADVMYPYYRIASDLAAGDIAAIRTLYAARDGGSTWSPVPGLPGIQLDPAPTSVTAAAWTFSGRAPGAVSVRWSNTSSSGVANGSTTWLASVPLSVGTNTVVFTATDGRGGQASASATITRTAASGTATPPGTDRTPPSLTIKHPGSSYFLTSAATVALSGTALDNVGVDRVTWTASGGTAGIASGATAWQTEAIPLNVGTNNIVVRAFDAAGNSSWRSVTIVRR